MRGFFYRLGNTIQHFMRGRYGIDEFGSFLLFSGMLLSLLSLIGLKIFMWLWIPSFILIIWSYVRCFSKKIDKRRRELVRYQKIKNRIRDKFAYWRRRFRERKTHKYYRCRLCKTVLRVPKGKGKIEITCPKCKGRMTKKT